GVRIAIGRVHCSDRGEAGPTGSRRRGASDVDANLQAAMEEAETPWDGASSVARRCRHRAGRRPEDEMCMLVRVAIAGLVCAMTSTVAAASSEFDAERRQMVEEVVSMVRETATETGLNRLSGPVLDALGKVPRHRFVPQE